MKYTYSDSLSGMQRDKFLHLSSLIIHIEEFGAKEASDGVVFQNDVAILEYISEPGKPIRWLHADIEINKTL